MSTDLLLAQLVAFSNTRECIIISCTACQFQIRETNRYAPMVRALNRGLSLLHNCKVPGTRAMHPLRLIFQRNDPKLLYGRYDDSPPRSERKPDLIATSLAAARRASAHLTATWDKMASIGEAVPDGAFEWCDALSCHELKLKHADLEKPRVLAPEAKCQPQGYMFFPKRREQDPSQANSTSTSRSGEFAQFTWLLLSCRRCS